MSKANNSMESSYAKAGIGGEISFGKRPAIVVVDFQKAFTHEESPLGFDVGDACKETRRLIMAAREKNIKVFYTRLGFNKNGADLNTLGKKCQNYKVITRNSWYYEFDERMDVRGEDIILECNAPSAFFGTSLAQILTPLYVDTLIVCGCPMAGPVYTTAVEAMSYGYRLFVPPETTADYTDELKDRFLWNVHQKYGEIWSVDKCIEAIGKIKPLKYDFTSDYYETLKV